MLKNTTTNANHFTLYNIFGLDSVKTYFYQIKKLH